MLFNMSWEDIMLPTVESLNAKLEEHKNERKAVLNRKRELFDKMFSDARVNIMKYIKERLEKSIDSHKAEKKIVIYYYEGMAGRSELPNMTSVECVDLYRECYPDIIRRETIFDYIMIPIFHKLQKMNYKVNVYPYESRMAYVITWV